MDKYTVKKFEGARNELLKQQNLVRVYLPGRSYESFISGDELLNLVGADEGKRVNHAEIPDESFLSMAKFFSVGQLERAKQFVDEILDVLAMYTEDDCVEYYIIVMRLVEELFEGLDNVYVDIDRHKSHIAFNGDTVRIKADTRAQLRGFWNSVLAEIEDVI